MRRDELERELRAIDQRFQRDLLRATPEELERLEHMVELDNRLIDLMLEREALVAQRAHERRFRHIVQAMVALLALTLLVCAIVYDLSLLWWLVILLLVLS